MSQPAMKRPFLALVLALGLTADLAAAELPDPAAATEPVAPQEASRWQFGLALGYGERSNPLALSDDFRMLVDLDIGWFGDRWFFDSGDAGFMLKDGDRFTLNLIGRFNSDRVFFSKTDSDIVVINSTREVGEPMIFETFDIPDRDYAIELGLELLSDGDWGYLQLAAHHDASREHEGYELYINYGRAFRRQRWSFEPSLGASWKSKRLNDYYWGVREEEASSRFPAYRAGAGLNTHARLAGSYRLNKHWAFFAVAEYERLNSATALSPIVEERDVRALFAGFSYLH